MSKTVSIGWFKQRSGNYALKGITISEGDRAYDSSNTFRDEDAKWLTKTLDARADVEISGNHSGQLTPDGYPEWALNTGQEITSDGISPLDWERASATHLRYFLCQLIDACDTDNGSSELEKLTSQAKAALVATDAGTYYSLDEARAIIGRRAKKPGKTKGKLSANLTPSS